MIILSAIFHAVWSILAHFISGTCINTSKKISQSKTRKMGHVFVGINNYLFHKRNPGETPTTCSLCGRKKDGCKPATQYTHCNKIFSLYEISSNSFFYSIFSPLCHFTAGILFFAFDFCSLTLCTWWGLISFLS